MRQPAFATALLTSMSLFVLSPSARADVASPPSVETLAVSPRDGLTAVPTNARLFVDVENIADGAVLRAGEDERAIVDADDAAELFDGTSLGELAAETEHELVIEDFESGRNLTIRFRTGDGPDTEAPSLVGDAEVDVCSFATECEGAVGVARGDDQDEFFDVGFTLPADDDVAVSHYLVFLVPEAGEPQPIPVVGRGPLLARWHLDDGDELASIHVRATLAGGQTTTTQRFVIKAVDLAGNESAPSDEIEVVLDRTSGGDFGDLSQIFGCSSTTTMPSGVPAAALVLLAGLAASLLRPRAPVRVRARARR
jgi:hypothetical protein